MNQPYSIWKSILSISMNYPILPYFSKTTQQLSTAQEQELRKVSLNTQSHFLNRISVYYANYKHVSHQFKQNKLQFLRDRLHFQQSQPQPPTRQQVAGEVSPSGNFFIPYQVPKAHFIEPAPPPVIGTDKIEKYYLEYL